MRGAMRNLNPDASLSETAGSRIAYLTEIRRQTCYGRGRSIVSIFWLLAQVISLLFTVPRLIEAWNLNVPDQMWRCIIEGAAICIFIWILWFIFQTIFDIADIVIDKNQR